MNDSEKLKMLDLYMKSNVAPILLVGIPTDALTDYSTRISASIPRSELNGHYEKIEFKPPKWYQELINNKSKKKILLIDDISMISKEEQRKFIEILKYRKVSVFKLPVDCIIIITCSRKETIIDEDIYSLVAHIR